MINEVGHVRADLVGGTLDLEPINLLLQNTVTLNAALSIEARVSVCSGEEGKLTLISKNYQQRYQFSEADLQQDNFFQDGFFSDYYFKEILFMVHICRLFPQILGTEVEIDSRIPAGSGLGGSSTIGVTLYQALSRYFGTSFSKLQALSMVRACESQILNKGVAGYQDYYPTLYGGILALRPSLTGVEVEQLYQQDFINHLKSQVALIYSGGTRLSGINNWEVYKAFFDGDQKTRIGMRDIANISMETYRSYKKSDWQGVVNGIFEEGRCRESLFENILTPEMKKLQQALKNCNSPSDIKVCGAGGGGCFLLKHRGLDTIENIIKEHGMEILEFNIVGPLE